MYDLSFTTFLFSGDMAFQIYVCSVIFFGIAVGLWGLIISMITSYIITSRKAIIFDTIKTKIGLTIFVFILSLIVTAGWVLPYIINDGKNDVSDLFFNIYNYIRISIIILSIISVIFSYCTIKEMKYGVNTPTFILVKRLAYYPVVQIICRFFVTWLVHY